MFGYVRCEDCGALVVEQFAIQTDGRCPECWKDRQALTALEVAHNSVRMVVAQKPKNRRRMANGEVYTARELKAREKARTRLANLFPDVYDMLLDEERVKLGLPPIARYEQPDRRFVASKTLDFLDVYDRLDSIGERCASDDAKGRQAETR